MHPAYAAAGVGQIDFLRVIGTAFLAGTSLKAAAARALRGPFRPEIVQGAKALHLQTRLSGKPAEDVHVMAAFGQDHGAALIRPAPVAPDIAVGVMPVRHMFHCVNGLNFANLTPAQNGFQRGVKPGVSQNVAHNHRPAGFMGLLLKPAALFQVRRNGLFQQQMIPLFQRKQRLGHMLAVLCGDNHNIRQPGPAQHLLAGGKQIFFRYIVFCPQRFQPLRTAVRSGNDFHLPGMDFLIGGIGVQPPAAAAADGKGDRI